MFYTDILYLPLNMLMDTPIGRHSFRIIGNLMLQDRLETLLVNIHITGNSKKSHRCSHNLYIEEEQTKQWPKEKYKRTNNDL